MGNGSPGTRVVPPPEICQYIYFTLYKHYFIGGLKKYVWEIF